MTSDDVTDTQPAPTVPDEAVEAAAEIFWHLTTLDIGSARAKVREILAATAPFIVAANQPEVDGDLRRQLCERAHEACGGACDGGCAEVAQGLPPFIQAYVAARVAAARAEDSRGYTVPDLDAIRARVEAATPGPWGIEYDNADDYEAGISGSPFPHALRGPSSTNKLPSFPEYDDHVSEVGDLTDADAEFIAHAREDVPALLAEVERLRAQRDAAVAQAEECRNYIIESGAAKLRRAVESDATP